MSTGTPSQTFATGRTAHSQRRCPHCSAAVMWGARFCPSCGKPQEVPVAGGDPALGRVIDGRYRVLEKLGEGGMGSVYKVEHVRIGKVMAVKVLRDDLAVDARVLQRFRGEATVVSKLSHPNTIQVFDFGEMGKGGGLYIAMEYLHGRDLASVLEQEKRLPEERVIRLAIQVLGSLAEAHEAGIVHRDIKPANVMVQPAREGREAVKVVDFGIAKLAGGAAAQQHITGVTEFVGTPNYVSPEQARGEELDARSDLYSLGAMLFELLTGRGPYEGTNPMAVVTKHLTEKVPSARALVPELSESIDLVVARALAKTPGERFQSATAMRESLEKVLGRRADTVSQPMPVATGGFEVVSREDWDAATEAFRWRERRRIGVLFLVLVGVAGGLGYGAMRTFGGADRTLSPTEEHEPNDEPALASALELEVPLSGTMGKPLRAGKSDLDTFKLKVATPGLLALRLTGVDDLNLVLELFDERRLARRQGGSSGGEDEQLSADADPRTHLLSDDGRLGQGELLRDIPVEPGTFIVRVSERPDRDELKVAHEQGRPPRPARERAGSPYTLEARLTPASEFDEHEPNDLVGSAQKLDAAHAVLGHGGLAVPGLMVERRQSAAAFDHYEVAPAEGGLRHTAFVVPPPEGQLAVWELEQVRAFDAVVEKPGLRGAPLPPPAKANARGIVVVPLSGEGAGQGVRLVPLGTTEVSWEERRYGLAFGHAGPGGLTGVLRLAAELERLDRVPQARALIDAVRTALPRATDLDKLPAEAPR